VRAPVHLCVIAQGYYSFSSSGRSSFGCHAVQHLFCCIMGLSYSEIVGRKDVTDAMFWVNLLCN